MKTFYEVNFEWSHSLYFREYDHAKDALWGFYLENCANETEEQKQAAKLQFDKFDFIEGIGYIYSYEFED